MKYARLTKEQFEEMHTEFINFLASQQIDEKEWKQIKAEKPELAEQEMDIFSDLIWEGALQNAQYIEHFSPTHIFLFHFDQEHINTVVVNTTNPQINFLEKSGLEWLADNIKSNEVVIRHGGKKFGADRNGELFDLIKQGGIFSNGDIYHQIKQLINQ